MCSRVICHHAAPRLSGLHAAPRLSGLHAAPRLSGLAASCLVVALACTDDVTPQPSTTTDPSGSDTGGDGDGDGDGEPSSVCGDGVVEGSETCEDGNTIDTDFCSNACTNSCALEWLIEDPLVVEGNSITGGDLAITSASDLIIASATQDAMGNHRAWIAAYDPNGAGPLWEQMMPGQVESQVYNLAIGPGDDVYATGSVAGDDGLDLWTAQVTPDGTRWWQGTQDGAADESDDVGEGITVGPDGVVAIGTIRNLPQNSDIWLRKFDFDNNELWTTTYSGPLANNGFSLDRGSRVTIAEDGRIYALGEIYVDFETVDLVLLSFGADGSGPDWELFLESGDTGHIYDGVALELDGAGSIYVAMTDRDSPLGTFWIKKLDLATGTETWSISNEDIATDGKVANWRITDLRASATDLVLLGWRRNEDYKPGLSREETWLAHFDVDGNPRCYAALGREIEPGEAGSTLPDGVVLPNNGHPIASGVVFTGEGFDRWLAQFGAP